MCHVRGYFTVGQLTRGSHRLTGFRYWEAFALNIDPFKKQVQCRATCQDIDTKVRAGVNVRPGFWASARGGTVLCCMGQTANPVICLPLNTRRRH